MRFTHVLIVAMELGLRLILVSVYLCTGLEGIRGATREEILKEGIF